MSKARRSKKSKQQEQTRSNTKYGDRGKPGECVWEEGTIGDIPKLDRQQKQELKKATKNLAQAMQKSPQLIEEMTDWILENHPGVCRYKSKEEKQAKIKEWLQESVSPGKMDTLGDFLLLEVPDWPHWNEIDPNIEYDWKFQWQEGNFLSEVYYMFVVDIIQIKRSIRIAFNCDVHLNELKRLRKTKDVILLRSMEELLNFTKTGRPFPGLILKGIENKLLNLLDCHKIGKEVAQELGIR